MLWLIEELSGNAGAARLERAATRAGHAVRRWDDAWWDEPAMMPPAGGPVVFHGSLGHAARVHALGRWRPGSFCQVEAFAWTAYAPRWHEHLANPRAIVTTVRALVADPRVAAPLADADGKVFVRPDSPLKPFAGRVVAMAGLTAAALDHGFYYDDLDLPVVVAPVQALGAEYRFVIAAGEVVAGSGYVADTRSGVEAAIPDEVAQHAARLACNQPPPEPVYVLDLVETEAGLRVLEVNPFSGADLYDCDRDAIVRAVAAACGA